MIRIRYLFILLFAIFWNTSFSQLKKANSLFQKQHFVKAIPLYEKLSRKSNSTQKEALIRLGDSYRLLNEFSKAEECYRKVLVMSQDLPSEFYYNFGYVLKINTKYTEALSQFEKYLKLKPEDGKVKNAIRSCQQIKYWQSKPIEYEVKNVEGINTNRSEICPVLLGNKLVYVGEKQLDFFEYPTNSINGEPFMNVFISTVNLEKASGQKTFSKKINSADHDGPVNFSSDGKTLLFTRVKGVNRKRNPDYVNQAKIYFASGKGTKWKDIKEFQYNSDLYSVAHPCLSPDGTKLFFTSNMPGGFGGTDIWMCSKSGDSWAKPVNLGFDINTSGDESFPYMRNDGTLFFSSNGLAGFGGLDIFTAKEIEGKWIVSRNESMNLNSSYDDFSVCFLNDSTGYFTSNRIGGKGKDDIYWFKYTNKYIKVSGTVLLTENKNNPADDVKIILMHSDGKLIDSVKTNKKGYFEFRNLDADKKYMAIIDENDPKFVGKARYYLMNDSGVISQVSNNFGNKKFAFRNLPLDINKLPDLYTDDDLTLAGNLLYGENPSKPIKNAKISITNPAGDIVETTTTNEFGAFAFRSLPADQNFIISVDESDLNFPVNTKITLTNKGGKEIKSFLTSNSKFKFNILAAEKTLLGDLDVNDSDLIMELFGYIYDQDKKPYNNAKLFLYNTDRKLNQTISTDNSGKFRFRNLKADLDYLFDVDETDPRFATLKKLFIADAKGRIYKELARNSNGKFEFKVLNADKVAMGEFSVDDPWLKVLDMKNKAKADSLQSITIIENIYYAFGDYKFDAAGQKVLDKVIAIMTADPNLNLELSSHTDSFSSDQYNLVLSQKRAKTAVDYMISKGIDKKRLKAIGYGESRLLNKCANGVECSDEEHAKNRRSEFKIVESSKS